jgi:hypothetical protein
MHALNTFHQNGLDMPKALEDIIKFKAYAQVYKLDHLSFIYAKFFLN